MVLCKSYPIPFISCKNGRQPHWYARDRSQAQTEYKNGSQHDLFAPMQAPSRQQISQSVRTAAAAQ